MVSHDQIAGQGWLPRARGSVVLIGRSGGRHLARVGGPRSLDFTVESVIRGRSQAIVDSRVLGAALSEHGVGIDALSAYESALLADRSALVLRNRGAGPFSVLGLVDEQCGGIFDDIDDVVSRAEISQIMASHKAAAGLVIDELNLAPPTIASV